MESGKAAFVLASTLTLILSVIGHISAKPTLDQQQWNNNQSPESPSHFDLGPIDVCIFACDHCFKGDSLVKCANECILTEAVMSIEWITTCPYLGRQYTHPGVPNTFRH